MLFSIVNINNDRYSMFVFLNSNRVISDWSCSDKHKLKWIAKPFQQFSQEKELTETPQT